MLKSSCSDVNNRLHAYIHNMLIK